MTLELLDAILSRQTAQFKAKKIELSNSIDKNKNLDEIEKFINEMETISRRIKFTQKMISDVKSQLSSPPSDDPEVKSK